MTVSVEVDSPLEDDRLTLRQFVAGLVVLSLVGGAFLLTTIERNSPFPDAAGHVAALYAAGPDALYDATDPRLANKLEVPDEIIRQEMASAIAQGSPTSESLITIGGTPLMRVPAGQLVWCVRPDGVLLLLCELGDLSPVAQAEGMQALVEVDLNRINLDDGAVLRLFISAPPGVLTEIDTQPEVLGDVGTWTYDGMAEIVADQFQQPGDRIVLGDGTRALVQLRASFDRTGNLPDADFTLLFANGSIRLTIPGPNYWFD